MKSNLLGALVLSVVLLANVAHADEYRFTCKNMYGAMQIIKFDAETEKAARLKIRKEKEYADYNNCRFLQVIKKEQLADKQNSWSGGFKDKLKMMLQTPPTGVAPNNQTNEEYQH